MGDGFTNNTEIGESSETAVDGGAGNGEKAGEVENGLLAVNSQTLADRDILGRKTEEFKEIEEVAVHNSDTILTN